MEQKRFYLTAGVKGNETSAEFMWNGVYDDERLTPKMAIRVARAVFGHRCGVTVSDGKTAYRLYANTHRKLPEEQGNDDL